MTNIDLDELERLARVATSGPWPQECRRLVYFREYLRRTGAERPDEDVAFISAANPAAILALIARVRELDARMRRVPPSPRSETR